MRFSCMLTCLIAFWVISLAADTFEELVMIQPANSNGRFKKFICIGEDDGAALAVNYNLRCPIRAKSQDYQEDPPCYYSSSSELDSCIEWNEGNRVGNWEVAESLKYPMGPVFDYRWKGLKEHPLGSEHQPVSLRRIPKSGVILFSARGLGAIDLTVCKGNNKKSCMNASITTWPNYTSAIWYPRKLDQLYVSEDMWRTFIFEWNTTKLELQPCDSGCSPKIKGPFGQSGNEYKLSVSSPERGRVRFHSYKYLWTRKDNSRIYAPVPKHHDHQLCVELLVSICSGCELRVSIVNSDGGENLDIGLISGNGNSTPGELPTWRFKKLRANLGEFGPPHAMLEFTTRTNRETNNTHWAIDRLRECKSADDVSHSSSSIFGTCEGYASAFATARCQKLSYKENSGFTADTKNPDNISSHLKECLRGKKTGICDYLKHFWTKKTFICDRFGCACAPGSEGKNCEIDCVDGSYGYNCRERCGKCETGTCSKKSGLCKTGCQAGYLPPYCRIKLEAPDVSRIGSTSAVLLLRDSSEINADEIRNFHFKLKAGERYWTIPGVISRNLSTIETTICDLEAETRYTVRAVMQAKTERGFWSNFQSPEENFTTKTSAGATMTDPALCAIRTPDENGANSLTYNETNLACTSYEVLISPMEVKWDHPGGLDVQIDRFEIEVSCEESKVRENPSHGFQISKFHQVSQHQQEYKMYFHLLPSTRYTLSIRVLLMKDYHGYIKPAKFSFQVLQSVGFKDGETPKVTKYKTYIELSIPAVVNATKDTRVEVVVEGLPQSHCKTLPENLAKLLNITEPGMGWIHEIFDAEENKSRMLKIGGDPPANNSADCLLDPEQNHVVVVVLEASKVDVLPTGAASMVKSFAITSQLPTPAALEKPDNETSYSWIIILLVFIIFLLLLFIWRRKILHIVKRLRRDNLSSYSQAVANYVKSRTTSTPRQLPPLPSSADPELPGACGIPEVFSWNRYSRLVGVKDFEDYVKDSIANEELKSQFAMLPRGLVKPYKYGSMPENKPKNRYANVIAYDDSRVILKRPGINASQSDYINANYVPGFYKKKAYIATQGPKPQTIVDFWRMVWQEESSAICMLANVREGGKKKCEQYWPDFGNSKTYGDIVVTVEKHEVFYDYTFRTFRVSCGEKSRRIEHMHYTGWPDHTVPMYSNSVIAYLKKLQRVSIAKGPIIVHCSAGIGRTGTIILCDICLHQAAATGTMDVFAQYKKLRDCRMNMVDNDQQYLFVHVVLTEYLVSLPTELKCNNYLPQVIEELKKKLPQHIERLDDTAWQDQALHFCPSLRVPVPEHLEKNRFPELAPVSGRVYLERYPTHDDNSDYISAVFIDGAKVERQYLASQLPLPSTLSDFYRLIADQRIKLVIILQKPDPNDPTCCDIIPSKEPFNPAPFLNVELKSSSGPEDPFGMVQLLLTDTSEGTSRTQNVTMLTCTEWGLGKGGKPPPPEELVDLWRASENIHREEGPTLILCHDGVTGCGLYLALSLLLERMAVAKECDIILAVRVIRRSRPEFVRSQEQFEYLYDAAGKYIEIFDSYANFA